MIRPVRRAGIAAVALAVGLAGGGAAGLWTQGTGPSPPPVPSRPDVAPPGAEAALPTVRPVRPDTLLVWTPGGLPPGLAVAVGDLPGVDHAAAVASGIAWLDGSSDASGAVADDPPDGLAIPVEVAGADFASYAAFLPPADRALIPLLARGQVALGATSARLRGLGRGATLRFGATRLRVAGVVSDEAIGAHEILASRATAAALGVSRQRYLLVDPSLDAARPDLTRAIRGLLPAGLPVRTRGPGETPFFRHGDAVLPPVRLKELFGEFAARRLDGGFLELDPAWVRRSIVTETLPMLGKVRCHRGVLDQVRGALDAVAREGLAGSIDPSGFAGCWSARFINRDPSSGALSHHSWGVALDVNAPANPYGHPPAQDARMVAAFERWGFAWGGRWLIPDGMHFEFVTFSRTG